MCGAQAARELGGGPAAAVHGARRGDRAARPLQRVRGALRVPHVPDRDPLLQGMCIPHTSVASALLPDAARPALILEIFWVP